MRKKNRYADYLARAFLYSTKSIKSLVEVTKLVCEYDRISALIEDKERQKRSDRAIQFVAETTPRSIIDAAQFCTDFWDKYGNYPGEE